MSDPLSSSQANDSEGHRLLIGLIGSGIQQSLSPAMHEREAAELGLRLHYQRIDLDRTGSDARALPELLRSIRTIGFDGLNVTFPCKQAILAELDDIADEALAIAAVNTVVAREGRLIGYNTDCSGWRWGFERALPQARVEQVVLLGAGGAGCAIAEALMRMGCGRLHLVDADPRRAESLAEQINRRYPGRARAAGPDQLSARLRDSDGLVHATPTGMDKLPGLPLDPSALQSRHWVSEIVYFPIETALLRAARVRGCAVVDGGGMAVGQAVGAFELFTGLAADPGRMARHFQTLLAARSAPPPSAPAAP